MSKSPFLLYILIVVHLQGSLASSNTEYVLPSTQISEEQRDVYCFNTLRPIMNHIAASQKRWTPCQRMERKLTALQKKLSSIEAAMDVPKLRKPENFDLIGSRFFYIEQHHNVNWFSASKICRQMGGYLATPRNEEELNGFKPKLIDGSDYWLGISDLADEGMFVSQATGNLAPFLMWLKAEPNNNYGEHCVELRSEHGHLMNDDGCTKRKNFICEAGDE